MGHLIKVERFDQGNRLEEARDFSVSSWEGIWDTVEGEMDHTGNTPSGMEGWEESRCLNAVDHECSREPKRCRQYLKDAIREWTKAAWEHNELATGSFYFAGCAWSSITFTWDGK